MGNRKTQTKRQRKSTLIHGMEETELLMAFETLAKTLDIEVRFEKGDFRSGMCRVHEDRVIIIRKDDDVRKKIEVFAQELCKQDLSGIYLVPAVQKMIEEQKEKNESDVVEDN